MIISSACLRLLGRSFAITITVSSSESCSLHVVDLDPVVGQYDAPPPPPPDNTTAVRGYLLLLIIIIIIIEFITATVWTGRIL